MAEADLKVSEYRKIRAYGELLITAVSWALSSILIKMYIGEIPPYHILMGRFAIATLFILVMQPGNVKRIKIQDIVIGVPLGFLVFVSYSFGVICLKYTSASKAGFLVSLSVLLIPLAETMIKKKSPCKWTIASVVIALAGMRLISGMNGTGFNVGDFFAICSSISYTCYILMLDKLGKDIEDTLLTFIQLSVVVVFSIIAMVFFEGFDIKYIQAAWLPMMVIGVFCTGVATLCQTRAQKVASPESVGIIFLGEPLFTFIMAILILHETMTPGGVIGGILILTSLVIAVLKKI